jgi:hypothetical protein
VLRYPTVFYSDVLCMFTDAQRMSIVELTA